MLNRKRIVLGLAFGLLLPLALARADGLQDFVLTQLDGKGTVDSIDAASQKIVIDDRSYVIASDATVFDVNTRRNLSIDGIKAGNVVGFKSKPLAKPTAPYDQSLIKIWILPSQG
jgi:hypothetical protein